MSRPTVFRFPPHPANARDAARQFEGLLLAQIMRSERESGNSWLGTGDATGESSGLEARP
jgi:hypothetical protein